jgi:hypothetical protein
VSAPKAASALAKYALPTEAHWWALFLAVAVMGACELYNSSVPNFVDTHTTVVWGTGYKVRWDLSAWPSVSGAEGIWFNPADTTNPIVLAVGIANPRCIDFVAAVLLNGAPVSGATGKPSSSNDQLIITVPYEVWSILKPGFKLSVGLSSHDGRVFTPYTDIPPIYVSTRKPSDLANVPATPRSISVVGPVRGLGELAVFGSTLKVTPKLAGDPVILIANAAQGYTPTEIQMSTDNWVHWWSQAPNSGNGLTMTMPDTDIVVRAAFANNYDLTRWISVPRTTELPNPLQNGTFTTDQYRATVVWSHDTGSQSLFRPTDGGFWQDAVYTAKITVVDTKDTAFGANCFTYTFPSGSVGGSITNTAGRNILVTIVFPETSRHTGSIPVGSN